MRVFSLHLMVIQQFLTSSSIYINIYIWLHFLIFGAWWLVHVPESRNCFVFYVTKVVVLTGCVLIIWYSSGTTEISHIRQACDTVALQASYQEKTPLSFSTVACFKTSYLTSQSAYFGLMVKHTGYFTSENVGEDYRTSCDTSVEIISFKVINFTDC